MYLVIPKWLICVLFTNQEGERYSFSVCSFHRLLRTGQVSLCFARKVVFSVATFRSPISVQNNHESPKVWKVGTKNGAWKPHLPKEWHPHNCPITKLTLPHFMIIVYLYYISVSLQTICIVFQILWSTPYYSFFSFFS